MQFITFIVSLIANFAVSALLIYCFDCYEFKWKDGKQISLRKPTVYDLKGSDDIDQISRYVDQVITPAHHYFLLRDEFKKYDSSKKIVSWLIMEPASILLVISCFKDAFTDFLTDNDPVVSYLLYALIAAVCALAYFIIYKIYKAKFSIDRIYQTEESLRRSFEYRERTKFTIDEATEWNNYLLAEHYKHVLSNVDEVRSREYISKALYFLAAILYVLFFMRFSY